MTKKLSLAFAGTPQIAADLLEGLLVPNDIYEIKIIITQEDKPAGKKLALTPTPVKLVAVTHNLEIFDKSLKENNNEADLLARFDDLEIDLCVLFAYGAIISSRLLNMPKYGFWNIHPSSLPRYRGPSPTAYPLIIGEKQTAVTLMQMNEKLDEGAIIQQHDLKLPPSLMRDELETEVATIAIDIVKQNLMELHAKGKVSQIPQKHTEATYTRLLKKQHGFVSIKALLQAIHGQTLDEEPLIHQQYHIRNNLPAQTSLQAAQTIYNLYRGLSPWPGIWTEINTPEGKRRLKLLEMHLDKNSLVLDTVQLEGKKPTDYATFNRSYTLQ
ncbi:MAG: methionyl-tRNA formyltransferase [Weeksellaceae bacterium]